MLQKITQLSPSAIRNIVDNNTELIPLYIQIISLLDFKVSQKLGRIYKCKCSDGYAALDISILDLNQSISEKIDEDKPIIKVMEFKTKDNLYIITQTEIIYEKSKLVGQPIEYRLYQQMNYHNPQGNSQIVPVQLKQNLKLKQLVKSDINIQIKEEIQFLEIPTDKQKVDINTKESDYKLISQLYPGMKDFKFKGRIISKSDITQFKSGKGYLFQIEIFDQEKCTIQGIFFNNLCDAFFDKIQIDKVYLFSQGIIKTNRYTNNVQGQSLFQIHFEEYSQITEIPDDSSIEECLLDIQTIDQIDHLELDQKIDILCFVVDIKKPSTFKSKQNQQLQKQSITVIDQSLKNVDITFFGQQVEKYNFEKLQIVAFRGLNISEYLGNRNLIFGKQSICYNQTSKLQTLKNYEEFITFYYQNKDAIQIKPRDLYIKMQTSFIEQIKIDFQESNDFQFQRFYEIRGYITNVYQKNNMFYYACELCNKRIDQEDNKQYFCKYCNKIFDKSEQKYIFSVRIADTTGNLFCNVSNLPGILIFKQSCDYFHQMTLQDREILIKKASFQYFRFLVLGKFEEYNNQINPRYSIINIIQDNFQLESVQLFDKVTQTINSLQKV